jgi:pimeloyl-ACP methyl ester carboxylesterase
VQGLPKIVLVHGAWTDGSSWSAVIEHLQADGFEVRAHQFPLCSLVDDVARLREVLRFRDGPTLLAGHSYGGQIITVLGSATATVVGLRPTIYEDSAHGFLFQHHRQFATDVNAFLDQGTPGPA